MYLLSINNTFSYDINTQTDTTIIPLLFTYLKGGLALVECELDTRSVTNLIVDGVTNKVVGEIKRGRLHVSPNSRYIITVSEPKLFTVFYQHDNCKLSKLLETCLTLKMQIRLLLCFEGGWDRPYLVL